MLILVQVRPVGMQALPVTGEVPAVPVDIALVTTKVLAILTESAPTCRSWLMFPCLLKDLGAT